jgi:hypothetical protein
LKKAFCAARSANPRTSDAWKRWPAGLSWVTAWEADPVYPVLSTPRPLQILSHLTYTGGGVTTSTESTYYTAPSGAGVIDFGTQRWSCAVNRRCAGLSIKDTTFVREVMSNVLRRFAKGPSDATDPPTTTLQTSSVSWTTRCPPADGTVHLTCFRPDVMRRVFSGRGAVMTTTLSDMTTKKKARGLG